MKTTRGFDMGYKTRVVFLGIKTHTRDEFVFFR